MARETGRSETVRDETTDENMARDTTTGNRLAGDEAVRGKMAGDEAVRGKMARDEAVRGKMARDETTDSETTRDETAGDETAHEGNSDQSLLDRRSYLKLAGAAAATVAVTSTNGSANDGYDVITVPAGETEAIEVASGEAFENTHIDMTAEEASAQITTSGDGWAIRNVAFEGTHPGGHYLLNPAATSEDAEGLVENVYLGDGQTEESSKGGIWVQGDHRGTITFRNLNVQQFVDNGLYGTDPGYDYHGSHGGVVHVEDSHFASNNIANIRVGSIDGRTCRVENCVVETGETPALSGGAVNFRGLWAWWGPVEVSDSDIGGDNPKVEQDERAGDPSIDATNTRWGSDADTDRVPDGVPTTPEEVRPE